MMLLVDERIERDRYDARETQEKMTRMAREIDMDRNAIAWRNREAEIIRRHRANRCPIDWTMPSWRVKLKNTYLYST